MQRLTSSTTKLSPSFPHRTTLSSLGFSSILRHGSAWQRRGQMAGGDVLVQLAHLQKLLAKHGPKTKGKHTKSLELLEPEPAAWAESMMGESRLLRRVLVGLREKGSCGHQLPCPRRVWRSEERDAERAKGVEEPGCNRRAEVQREVHATGKRRRRRSWADATKKLTTGSARLRLGRERLGGPRRVKRAW
jgi:hypothetical protein